MLKPKMLWRKLPTLSPRLLWGTLSLPHRSYARLNLGQPHHSSHPHLLTPDQLTPGISRAEYALRRQRLEATLPPDTLLVLPSHPEQYISNDIPYVFRQQSDFFYFTGLSEPDCLYVVKPGQSFLFVRPREPQTELWEGGRVGPDLARSEFGFSHVYPLSEIDSIVGPLMKQATHLLLEEKSHPRLLQHLSSLFHESTNAGGNPTKKKNVYAAKSLLHRFRAVKSPAEISLMRQSCSIAARALNQVAARLPTLGHEYQAAACFEYECKMQGAQRLSYPSVVASGLNALTLHYIRNDNALGRDDLVLMDAGCELHMYSSDISRTYPRSGKYSAAQRLLVDIVLDVQQTVLGYAESRLANYTPLTLHDMHRVSVTQMAKNLCASGVLVPEKSHGVSHEEMVQKYVSKWYPHSIGHHLGIDVHDVQQYEAQGGPLSSGMVVTVEPGLYIGDDADVHPEFRNTGIRIEDDVLIHANGIEVLTHEAVKLPDQIEHLMQQAK